MTWTTDPKKPEDVNEHGYRISWAHDARGTWHNAWSPTGKHIDASYNKDKMQAACDAHREMLAKQRAMKAAAKAAKGKRMGYQVLANGENVRAPPEMLVPR